MQIAWTIWGLGEKGGRIVDADYGDGGPGGLHSSWRNSFVVKREGKRYVVLWCDNSRVKNKAADPTLDAVVNLSESQKKELRHHSMRLFSYGVQNIAQRIYLGVYLCLYIVVHL